MKINVRTKYIFPAYSKRIHNSLKLYTRSSKKYKIFAYSSTKQYKHTHWYVHTYEQAHAHVHAALAHAAHAHAQAQANKS